MCYFSNAFRNPQATINAICHALNDPKFDRVDFIVGRGISGTLVLIPVSLRSGIPCGAIRKPLDTDTSYVEGGSHSDSDVESYRPDGHQVNRYIIIDDLIDSGCTVQGIMDVMTETYVHCLCVGIILYQGYDRENYFDHPVTSLGHDIINLGEFERMGVWR